MRKSAVIATTAVALTVAGTLIPTQANAAKVKFGAALGPTVAPSASLPASPCNWSDPTIQCSFVQNSSYGRIDGEVAPLNGTLKKVHIIAGGPGSFTLQLVKTKNTTGVYESKVKAVGPTFNYTGQTADNWATGIFRKETFRVNMPIKRGWRLALKTTDTSVRRCVGGFEQTLIHYPALVSGWGFDPVAGSEPCDMLIEGVIKY